MAFMKQKWTHILAQCVRRYASSKNLCSALYGPKDLQFEEREIPKLKDGQVLVKIDTVGICGTDMHFYQNGKIGSLKCNKPFVLGHEGAGTIVDLSENVKELKVGDRVALEPGVSCRKCYHCKTGRYNLCQHQDFHGLPPTDGFFRQYIAYDADFCYKIPDNMTMEEASLLETLSVGIHGARRSGIQVGSNVLILGAGSVGLMALLAAKAFGATKIAITDIFDHRLATARGIGADLTINVANKTTSDVVELLEENFGELADIAVECVGLQPSVELAIKGVKSGGCVTCLALSQETIEFPILDIVCREINICSAMKYVNTWPVAIKLMSSERVKLNKLSRAYYGLDKIKEGFEKSQKGEVTKVFIKCHP